MKQQLFIVSLFFCVATMWGQSVLRRAEKHFEGLAYTEAAKEYEEYFQKEKDPGVWPLIHAAEANYYIGNTAAAIILYKKAFNLQGDTVQEIHLFHYIKALRSEERYEKADEIEWMWLQNRGDDASRKRFTTQKKYLDSLAKQPDKFKLDNLAINTNKADFGTAFYGTKVVYASAKDTVRDGAKTYAWNQQPYLTLYVADRDTATGAFVKEKKFMGNAQTGYHNAAAAFSPDLKTVYVSVNNVDKKNKLQDDKQGTNNIQLVYGEVQGERLNKKQIAAFNSDAYSTGQPAVSADGNWLFFVSDMPGGYGGTDIYIAPLYSDGKIGTPVNVGDTINTKGNEMFPFATATALYFSSDGHYGLGGLDVFVSNMDGNTFTSPQNRADENIFSLPQNMGKPTNSNRDDFAYIVDKTGNFGYLSSNRAEGKGDDDIYYFTRKPEPCGQLITGRVINKKSGLPIEGVSVKAQVNGVGYTDASKSDGTYTINIPCGDGVIVEGTKPDYTTGKPNDKNEIELSAYADLVKKEDNVEKVAINPIYFDFDQYYITPQAAAELDKVVFVMQNFPQTVIKIESHTDSRGNDDYNLRLSDDRAKSTYSYIVSKGIAPARIESVKGYGETQLRNKCSNGVACTDEEHQLNRRSDFIVVKK